MSEFSRTPLAGEAKHHFSQCALHLTTLYKSLGASYHQGYADAVSTMREYILRGSFHQQSPTAASMMMHPINQNNDTNGHEQQQQQHPVASSRTNEQLPTSPLSSTSVISTAELLNFLDDTMAKNSTKDSRSGATNCDVPHTFHKKRSASPGDGVLLASSPGHLSAPPVAGHGLNPQRALRTSPPPAQVGAAGLGSPSTRQRAVIPPQLAANAGSSSPTATVAPAALSLPPSTTTVSANTLLTNSSNGVGVPCLPGGGGRQVNQFAPPRRLARHEEPSTATRSLSDTVAAVSLSGGANNPPADEKEIAAQLAVENDNDDDAVVQEGKSAVAQQHHHQDESRMTAAASSRTIFPVPSSYPSSSTMAISRPQQAGGGGASFSPFSAPWPRHPSSSLPSSSLFGSTSLPS